MQCRSSCSLPTCVHRTNSTRSATNMVHHSAPTRCLLVASLPLMQQLLAQHVAWHPGEGSCGWYPMKHARSKSSVHLDVGENGAEEANGDPDEWLKL